MAGVVDHLLSGEDVVELEVTGAGSQDEETLAGREGTTGETALVSIAFVEDRHRTKPAGDFFQIIQQSQFPSSEDTFHLNVK